MNPERIAELTEKYKLEHSLQAASGEWELFVPSQNLFELLKELKTLEAGGYVHLADLSAYDEYPLSPRFYVFYELISMEKAQRLRIVTPLNDDSKTVTSVTELWAGAGWLEREVFDMFGIKFEGNKDLRRLLLPPSFKGHPLEKTFVVDYRQEFLGSTGGAVFDPFGNNIVEEIDPS